MYSIDDYRIDINKESNDLYNFMLEVNNNEIDYEFLKFSATGDMSYSHRMLNDYIGEPYYKKLYNDFVNANVLKKDKEFKLVPKSDLSRALLANITLSIDSSKVYRDILKDSFNKLNPHRIRLNNLLKKLNNQENQKDIIKVNSSDFDFIVNKNTIIKLMKRSSEESAFKLLNNELDINFLLGSEYVYSMGFLPIKACFYEENSKNIFYSGLIVYDNIGQLYNVPDKLSTFNNDSNKNNVVETYSNFINSIERLNEYLAVDLLSYTFEPLSVVNAENNYPYNINYGFIKVLV